MNRNLQKFIEIAATIIPAIGALAKDDKSENIANDIAAVLKAVAKQDEPDAIETIVADDPEVKAELEIRLAEIANRQEEAENRIVEEQRRAELEKAQREYQKKDQEHQHELERVAKDLESTEAARAHAQQASLSDKWWVAGINPLLSILITVAFLGFVYLIAKFPISGEATVSVDGAISEPVILTKAAGDSPPDAETNIPVDDENDLAAAEREAAAPAESPDQTPVVAQGEKTRIDQNGQTKSSNKEVFYVAFGALATAFVTVIGFHFGSSSGSKRKSELQRLYGTRGTVTQGVPPVGSPPISVGPARPNRRRQSEGVNKETHPFEAFWMKNLPHVEHFNWRELLFKGASNKRYKSNTDPSEDLYKNVIPLVEVLDKIRKEIGEPIQLISIYRSPKYNRDIGGASFSRHMHFDAADFKVLGPNAGNTGDWSDIARKLRDKGEFTGGIGIYGSFVHIDTRGKKADWDKR
jgi:Peptidase M15